MSSLKLHSISKAYGQIDILTNIDISIEDGEFLVLVGPRRRPGPDFQRFLLHFCCFLVEWGSIWVDFWLIFGDSPDSGPISGRIFRYFRRGPTGWCRDGTGIRRRSPVLLLRGSSGVRRSSRSDLNSPYPTGVLGVVLNPSGIFAGKFGIPVPEGSPPYLPGRPAETTDR